MRAVAYSIRSFEKEPLARANQKKHDITLISNPLGLETALYAEGKEAVIISNNDTVSEPVINRLADLGVKFITIRSSVISNIDRLAAEKRNIKLANVPPQFNPAETEEMALVLSLQEIASSTIHNLDRWQDDKCLGGVCTCGRACGGVEEREFNDKRAGKNGN